MKILYKTDTRKDALILYNVLSEEIIEYIIPSERSSVVLDIDNKMVFNLKYYLCL